MTVKNTRTGAVGALMDIYEAAISKLKTVIEDIPDDYLTVILDPSTTDESCKTIQAILTHVVSSGYGYATSIHNLKGHNAKRPDKSFHLTIAEYTEELNNVFAYTENVFKEISDDELEQFDDSLKIKAGWGQLYDIEQMTEHAIVHILRHTRQIARIKEQKLK
ncbi:DinB family protein [Solitalea canadensis]|uniref:DinB family protein n=1 Tax=Solitalea canadensis (strain ATCC 29591 / DSM 3403 / JCM 21819 / LMG 8368 / NBRC 15130 / NCIMB 12057 / USAM 9D) TaxID=929556 RepID=H8KTB3_SOLCM|nr:DinB family protein [Solitalea canadensis]AFD06250.1 DinB family protein [Solitalea canadensis DSM 3403]